MKEWQFKSAERKDENYGVVHWTMVLVVGCLAGFVVVVMCLFPLIEVKSHPGNVDDSYAIMRGGMQLGTVVDRRAGIPLFQYNLNTGPYPNSIVRTGTNEWTVIFQNYKEPPAPDIPPSE
jgi:hypothetical protein